MPNTLRYGDNQDILRRHVLSESVDLVYLAPPFHSNASNNVFFTEQSTHQFLWKNRIALTQRKGQRP